MLLLYRYFFSLIVTLSVQFTVQTVQYCYFTAISSHSLLHCQYNSLYKQYSTATVPLFPLTHFYTVSTIRCTKSIVLLLYSYFFSLTVTLSVQVTVQTVQYCYCTVIYSHFTLHCQYNSLYKLYGTAILPLFLLTYCYIVSKIHCTNSIVLLLYRYFVSLTVTLSVQFTVQKV